MSADHRPESNRAATPDLIPLVGGRTVSTEEPEAADMSKIWDRVLAPRVVRVCDREAQ